MTKQQGPRELRRAPGNLLQGGVKDEARPGAGPGSVAGGPRGDRSPALLALALQSGTPLAAFRSLRSAPRIWPRART